jgi:hypothetical protein
MRRRLDLAMTLMGITILLTTQYQEEAERLDQDGLRVEPVTCTRPNSTTFSSP